MAISYRPYEPQQQMLLPASLQDWLPKGHLAYFISDTVDALDLKAFYARYAGGGARNQPFHPAMMVKLLVYGYATGVFSSRKIERRLHDDLAFRMLGAGNFPKHRTIRDFRALHLLELSELFVQVVKLAGELGLVKLGTVAIDGTKIKANASRHKAMSFERMQQAEVELKAQIDALLERAKSADAAEAEEPQVDIPAEIERREVRLKAITEARQRIEKRQQDADIERGRTEGDECKPRDEDGKPTGGRYKREFGVPDPKAQDNFTDPESRIMKRAGGGFDASYNAQTAVDDTAHIIVAAELTNNAADVGQLVPMLKAVKANTGKDPEQALADAGYRSEQNFEDLADSPTKLVVAMGREGKRCADIDAEKNPHTAAMADKMQTEDGKAAYRRRKWIAEPPNGRIKSVLGFRQFSLRGLHRVQAEFKLVCLALNLRRMGAMQAA
jgi:transposase